MGEFWFHDELVIYTNLIQRNEKLELTQRYGAHTKRAITNHLQSKITRRSFSSALHTFFGIGVLTLNNLDRSLLSGRFDRSLRTSRLLSILRPGPFDRTSQTAALRATQQISSDARVDGFLGLG